MIRVFLDANVYFAGFLSPKGASALVLELARRGKLAVVASRLVLREADRNLRRKTDPKTLKAFHRFLKGTKIDVPPFVTAQILERYEAHIHPKDAPILAAAMEAEVDYLMTLDRKHFLTPKALSSSKRVKILTPGDFLREHFRI